MLGVLALKLNKSSPRLWAELYQIRCVCHILHLAAGDMASKKHVDFEFETAKSADVQSSDPLYGFEANEALEHLFNFVKKVHVSTQLHDEFKTLSGGLTIPQANTTRWISWYRSIQRATELKLKIEHFQDIHEFEAKATITPDDWLQLEKVGPSPLFMTLLFKFLNLANSIQ